VQAQVLQGSGLTEDSESHTLQQRTRRRMSAMSRVVTRLYVMAHYYHVACHTLQGK